MGLQAVVHHQDLDGGETSQQGAHLHNHNLEPGGIHLRLVRIDFPKFDGEDTMGWLYRANQFFTYN